MNYYYDTEFIEGTQRKSFFIKTKPTIDLISIGIVSEDDRQYYAISKDFNLKEAWNRFDGHKTYTNLPGDTGTNKRKNYWVRENVLHQIHYDLLQIEKPFNLSFEEWKEKTCKGFYEGFKNYKNLKRLLKKFGKSNKQIAEEIKEFVGFPHYYQKNSYMRNVVESTKPIFYNYYGAYDHVVLCWLFGKMVDLPNGFPMYSVDLKQELYMKLNRTNLPLRGLSTTPNKNLESKLKEVKGYKSYPKQGNEHNALDDAFWNKKLHEFIKHEIG